MTPTLILPIAPPAAGKSTLRHWLLERGFDPDGTVCPDDYRRIMTGDQADQDSNGAVFGVVDTIVMQRLKHGLDVFVDATNLRFSNRDAFYSMAHGYNATIILVLFDTTHNECRVRNAHRTNPVPDSVMQRMFDLNAEITKSSLRREVEGDAQIYTPEQFMRFSWAFLKD